MVDFHTHVLPFMDDGSQSIGESLTLLRMLNAQGVTGAMWLIVGMLAVLNFGKIGKIKK